MARYIDADTLIAHLKDEIEGCKPPFCGRANGKSIAYGTILGLKSAISFAETLSTADVVPKSEVEKAIDDLKRYIILNEDISKKCKLENGEQNEEYWKGKLSAFLQIRGYLDTELKKKYTEVSTDEV